MQAATSLLSSIFRPRDPAYELLPTGGPADPDVGGATAFSQPPPESTHPPPSSSGKYIRIAIYGTVALLLFLAFFVNWGEPDDRDPWHGLPHYDDLFNVENGLPQNNPDLPWPEGRDGRFVKFEATYDMTGLNNQLQDILFSAQLAYMSNRAYVFQDYIWDRWAGKPVVNFRGKYRSTVIPIAAFIKAAASGEPIGKWVKPTGEVAEWDAPRAVRYGFFEGICPPERQTIVNVTLMREKYDLVENTTNPPVDRLMKVYQQELLGMNDTCVVLRGDHVFTYGAFSQRALPAFPLIKDSPVFTQFGWSPLVHSLVQRNIGLFLGQEAINATVPKKEFPGLLAVHLRRGDFLEHCTNLKNWGAIYNGWNDFAEFRPEDKFPYPRPYAEGITQQQRDVAYTEHCLPTIDQVFQKITKVKADWEGAGKGKLKRIYLLTNAERAFLDPLRNRLMSTAGWEQVAMSSDMIIGPEEVEIDNAADMMIGQMAEVFLGNGFSSLTSNINLFRMVRKVDTDSIRMW